MASRPVTLYRRNSLKGLASKKIMNLHHITENEIILANIDTASQNFAERMRVGHKIQQQKRVLDHRTFQTGSYSLNL